jgi:two-component system, OmpR family, sensor kinase
MTARSAARPRLRTRLIAWYAGTLCCVLLLTAAALRFGVERTLDRAHVESLESSVALFRQFFRVEIAEYRSVEATLSHIAGELVFEDRVIDVHRPDGSLFSVTGAPVIEDYPSLRAPVRTLVAPLDPLLAPGWTIEVHGSKATLDAASRRLDLWLLGGIPVVVLLAAALGWWLAGRALRPIGALAAQAQRLDAAAGSRLQLPDTTDELGRLGSSFNALLDRLDDALAQQRRFLADAAHELRTPIARLRSRVEMGRVSLSRTDAPAVRAEADRMLATLDGELRNTSEVLHGLLALAHADADTEPSRFSVGYLDDALSDELPRWRETAESAGVQVILGTFDEVQARFDAGLMRRLLALLLDNAIRYSPAGTVITVHLAVHGSQVRLTVEDQGIGITAADREAVFERFHRTEEARAHRADGSGLGLALARWIVMRHGGTIRAASRADGGAGVALIVAMPIGVPAGELLVERGEPVGSLPGPA